MPDRPTAPPLDAREPSPVRRPDKPTPDKPEKPASADQTKAGPVENEGEEPRH